MLIKNAVKPYATMFLFFNYLLVATKISLFLSTSYLAKLAKSENCNSCLQVNHIDIIINFIQTKTFVFLIYMGRDLYNCALCVAEGKTELYRNVKFY